MSKNIVITNIKTPFGEALASVFSRNGYTVFSLENLPAKIDIFAETTDFNPPEEDFEAVFRKNAISPIQSLEKVLPLMEGGEKRLFFVSSAKASINETHEKSGYAYKMSKAALHQFLQMLHNEFKGYTFRVFDPMGEKIAAEAAAESAFLYITRRRGTENDDPLRDDENNLSLRDAEGRQHAW